MHAKGTTPRRPDPKLTKTGTTGVYKRGTRYVVSFTGPDGRRRWASAKTLAEARRIRAERVADVSRGEYQEASRLTLREYAERWTETYAGRTGRGVRPGTIAKYRDDLNRHVLPVLGSRRLTAITAQDVKGLAKRLADSGLGPNSVRNAIAPLRAIFATATEENLIRSNPCATIRLPGPQDNTVKALEDRELVALIAAAPAGRDRLVVETLANSGLRISECLGLRWADLDLDAGVVSVTEQLVRGVRSKTKTRNGERLVKLPAGLVAKLREHRIASRWSREEHPVFATRTGKPLSRHNVYRTVTLVAKRAGCPAWTSPHTLRHTYARRFLLGRQDIRMLATLLGHADPAFTMRRYARFLPSDVRALDVDFLERSVA
jgi:integrase